MIVGFGVAGQAAFRALLTAQPGARVLVIDDSTDLAESRANASPSGCPPTKKPQWEGGGIAGVGAAWAAIAGSQVEYMMGSRATTLDSDRHTITVTRSRELEEGGEGREEVGGGKEEGGEDVAMTQIEFERCVLATGSRPRPPPPGYVDPRVWGGVSVLRSGGEGRQDREELSREVAAGRSVTVIGSSFQALELACSLQEKRNASSQKKKVKWRKVSSY